MSVPISEKRHLFIQMARGVAALLTLASLVVFTASCFATATGRDGWWLAGLLWAGAAVTASTAATLATPKAAPKATAAEQAELLEADLAGTDPN